MVSAIGSSPTLNPAPSSPSSTAGIEAQIARDQKELSNCVNCASAETKQGQADIQALSNKINIAKARLEQITASNPGDQVTASGAAFTIELSEGKTSAGEVSASENAATTLNSSDSSTGRFVDEYV